MSDHGAAQPPDPPGLEVQRSEAGGVVVVALSGELDLANVSELEAAIGGASEAAGTRLLVDLAGLRFIDSSGLAALIRANTAVTGAGGRFVIVATPGSVRRTFATTGLDSMLALFERRDEAERSLAI